MDENNSIEKLKNLTEPLESYFSVDSSDVKHELDLLRKQLLRNEIDLEIDEYISDILELFETKNIEKENIFFNSIVPLYNCNKTDDKNIIASRLYLIEACIGLREFKILKSEEINEFILKGSTNINDWANFLFTLRIGMLGPVPDLQESVISYLKLDSVVNKAEFNWPDLLLYTMLLNYIWSVFEKLADINKYFILENYFYRSLVVGIPVRLIISDYIYDSNDETAYIFKLGLVSSSLNGNKELVILDTVLKAKENLVNLLAVFEKKFEEKNDDKVLDKDLQLKFVKDIYLERTETKMLVYWLCESMDIILKIERAKLIEEPFYKKKITEIDLYDDEVVNLFSWFLYQNKWQKIIEYFKNDKHRVSLKTFFYWCFKDYDINAEETHEKFLAFTDLLQKNGILKPNQDILIFHEEDGSFHWNEELLV